MRRAAWEVSNPRVPDSSGSSIVERSQHCSRQSARVARLGLEPLERRGQPLLERHHRYVREQFAQQVRPGLAGAHVANLEWDAVVLAVAHEQFADLAGPVRGRLGDGGVVYDVKGVWPRELVDGRL